ncbi:hypothetical protein DBY21_09650 [Candidatus Gastranaerophilales bacterium]|nr:MAG: hypothetical protein DBY21_09650 [Candidatus Gastranaerophilales bacterium]
MELTKGSEATDKHNDGFLKYAYISKKERKILLQEKVRLFRRVVLRHNATMTDHLQRPGSE